MPAYATVRTGRVTQMPLIAGLSGVMN